MSQIFINHNGALRNEQEAVFLASNRGYRYGLGIFETMYFDSPKIRLADFHFERMFSSIDLLQLNISEHWTPAYFSKQIQVLAEANHLRESKIRLSVSGGSGNLADFSTPAEFLIEAVPLQIKQLHPLRLGLYNDDVKSVGKFSNLKSSSYLLNTMAMQFAVTQNCDEVLLLNHHGRICESTISNIFWIKDKTVYTVPLSEGPVAGIMRRHLIDSLPSLGYTVLCTPIERNSLLEADEIFLTNAIQVIRPVAEFEGKSYSTSIAEKIYSRLFSTNE